MRRTNLTLLGRSYPQGWTRWLLLLRRAPETVLEAQFHLTGASLTANFTKLGRSYPQGWTRWLLIDFGRSLKPYWRPSFIEVKGSPQICGHLAGRGRLDFQPTSALIQNGQAIDG